MSKNTNKVLGGSSDNNIISVQEFNGVEVGFRTNKVTGTSEVRINEIAKFCGWTTIANSGNETIRWARVNEKLAELGIAKLGNGDYIQEYIMYPLIGKANNEKATQFMLWVGKTLVDLRTKGVVILEGATESAIDYERKFGKYRIRKTFTNSKSIVEDYKQFVELSKIEWKAKRLNNVDRVKLCSIVVNTLHERINTNVLDMKASEILMLQELICDIKTDIIKLSNKKNGGIKTSQTKVIKKLQEQLENNMNTYPRQSEFITLDISGFSNNYMYKYSNGGTYKSDAYKNWIRNFPTEETPSIEEWECDFTKPIEVFINYTAKKDFDIRNFDKSFIDVIFNNLGVDDNIVESVHSQRVGTVSTYQECKISFFIRNKQ
ncbi:hypothetical protein LL033_11910 [Clostridium estertheticum]|uniref:hypothetical protein n=1 Tax=Clostridium estertheticum TaxID=238834 RepID=UPI001C0AAD39|nr:hypothetical protein [Clostridium estertheticum]MBU3215856.1 hypothetical protein [Clostridium estertheticum]WAG57812.1 hypothetical protein LL033_11910 [Clostridium estertheticum]